MIDTSSLEATMTEKIITDKISMRGIALLNIEEIQRHLNEYEELITLLEREKTHQPEGAMGERPDIEGIQAQIDRVTEKYFLMQKQLDSVM